MTSSPPPRLPPEAGLRGAPAESVWNKIIQGIIYGLTFLIPLLFTPWTFEPLEFSKQLLLFMLVAAAILVWLLKLLVLRSISFVKTPLDLPLLIFLAVYLLASIFSVDRVASFLGFYGSFRGNFFQILFLVLFYYLVVNHFRTSRDLRRLVGVAVLSVGLALLYACLQFFGLFVARFPFAKAASFNSVGTLLAVSLYAAFAVVLSVGFKNPSWYSPFGGRIVRIITVAAAFLVLLTVNFLYAWAALLVGLLAVLIFQAGLAKAFVMKNLVAPLVLLLLVIALVVIQLVFPYLSLRSIFNFNLPIEVRLDYATAGPVLKSILTQRPVLGLGPNTFLYAFSKYRAENFNLSPFWNVRFDKAPSEAAEYLVGSGILGLLAFEILSVVFAWYGLFFMLRKRDEAGLRLALPLFASFLVFWVAHWIFFFNTVLAFSFWLCLAAFMAASRFGAAEKTGVVNFSLAATPRQTVSVVTSVSLALILLIVFMFFAAAVYAADIFYRQGLAASARAESFDEAQSDFESAIRLNRFRPDYYLTYGEFLFVRINQELAKKDANPRLLQQWLQTSINTSRAAVDLSPANWTAWERLANLYSIARPLVAGVDKFIIDSLVHATEADAKNPILFTELGQIYRLAARRLDPAILGKGVDSDSDGLSDEQEKALGSDANDPDTNGNNVLDGNEVLSGLSPAASGALPDDFLGRYIKTDAENLLRAEEAFRKAMALKPDYAAAYYQLSQVLSQEQKYDEAIAELEGALERFPNNVDLKFQLGVLYFNTGKTDPAARQFQEITALVPNHSNARFSLALSYERLGKPRKALEEYRKVLQLNPGNTQVEAKVRELEAAVSKE